MWCSYTQSPLSLHWNFSLETVLTPQKVSSITRFDYCSKCISSRRKKSKEMALPSITADSGRNDGSLVLSKPCRSVLLLVLQFLFWWQSQLLYYFFFFFKHPSCLHCCKPHLQFRHFFYGNVVQLHPTNNNWWPAWFTSHQAESHSHRLHQD